MLRVKILFSLMFLFFLTKFAIFWQVFFLKISQPAVLMLECTKIALFLIEPFFCLNNLFLKSFVLNIV